MIPPDISHVSVVFALLLLEIVLFAVVVVWYCYCLSLLL